MNFELFGPVPKYYVHHKGCGHSRAARAAQAANGDVLAKRMASERFGAEGLLAAMMAIAEVRTRANRGSCGTVLISLSALLPSLSYSGECPPPPRAPHMCTQ